MQAKDNLKTLGKAPDGSSHGTNSSHLKTDGKPPFRLYVKSNSCSVNLHEMSAANFVVPEEYFAHQMEIEEHKQRRSPKEQCCCTVQISGMGHCPV